MKLIWQSTGERPFGTITINVWPTIRSQNDAEDNRLELDFEDLSEKIQVALEKLEENSFTAQVIT